MAVSKKIEAIDNEIEQNKTQYDLDRQTAQILVLSSRNVGKYEFLTEKYVLTKRALLKKLLQSKDLNIQHQVVS